MLYGKFLDGNAYGIPGPMQGKWPSFVNGKQIDVPLSAEELEKRRQQQLGLGPDGKAIKSNKEKLIEEAMELADRDGVPASSFIEVLIGAQLSGVDSYLGDKKKYYRSDFEPTDKYVYDPMKAMQR